MTKKLLAVLIVVSLFLTAVLVFAQQQADTAMLGDGQLHVVMCGTGSPLADATRASACVAVIAAGEVVLIDVGPGSWRQVAVNRIPTAAVSAVLLTHFHSDHIGDLGEAVTQTWLAGRAKPLEVFGPPGVEKVVAGFAQAYSQDVEYRIAHHTETMLPRAAAGAVAREVKLKSDTEAAVVFERNGLKVTAFNVEHSPVKPAYGYRLDYKGRSVVVSGDTAKSMNLAKHTAGADLLIHDVLAKDVMTMAAGNADRSGDKRRAKLIRDILTYHASPAEAAEIANEAKVETLVFTHMVPPLNPPVTEQMFLRGVADIFKGKVVLAKDGMRFDLSAKN
ncbi:MAG TPA: MBL fold metallo-hydrolase [Blastocatellia bacterium]|nr:MBL fold metallo-hydrolase [Blastocatellia bacterium]